MLTAWALLLFLAMWVRSTSGGPLSFRIGKIQNLIFSMVTVEKLPTRVDPRNILFIGAEALQIAVA